MQASLRTARARFAAGRLAVLGGAVALGLLLQHALGERLAGIAAGAEHDVVAARAELAWWIRFATTAACGTAALLGLVLALACRAPASAARFPPPGLLALGAARTVTGPHARTFTRVGLVLGVLLHVVSVAGVVLGWYVAAVLAACRA